MITEREVSAEDLDVGVNFEEVHARHLTQNKEQRIEFIFSETKIKEVHDTKYYVFQSYDSHLVTKYGKQEGLFKVSLPQQTFNRMIATSDRRGELKTKSKQRVRLSFKIMSNRKYILISLH